MKASINAGREGTVLVAGERLYDPSTRARYQCEDGGLYHAGDTVTIIGLDGAADLSAGSTLVWEHPRPGCGLKVTIVDPTPSANPFTKFALAHRAAFLSSVGIDPSEATASQIAAWIDHAGMADAFSAFSGQVPPVTRAEFDALVARVAELLEWREGVRATMRNLSETMGRSKPKGIKVMRDGKIIFES